MDRSIRKNTKGFLNYIPTLQDMRFQSFRVDFWFCATLFLLSMRDDAEPSFVFEASVAAAHLRRKLLHVERISLGPYLLWILLGTPPATLSFEVLKMRCLSPTAPSFSSVQCWSMLYTFTGKKNLSFSLHWYLYKEDHLILTTLPYVQLNMTMRGFHTCAS